jgi:rubrerythrin
MKYSRRDFIKLGTLSMAAVGLGMTGLKPVWGAETLAAVNLKNLQTAYGEEMLLKAKLQVFAKKADAEGYLGIASLFRSATKTKEMDVREIKEVIEKSGGKLSVEVVAPAAKSTKENLDELIKTITKDKTDNYPGYIKQARTDKALKAVRVFNFTLQADLQILKYAEDAAKNLDAWKKDKKVFFVCPECGYMVDKITFDRCPVCFTPKEKFIKVS